MIKIVLIDDEQSACDNLSYLLNKHIDDIEILGVANSVDEGIAIIENKKPDLVFLDIEMPQKNGFELIRYFENIDFHVIFVTAYESHAIKAFEVSALDYLLKPIDVDRLKNAVEKFNQQKNTFNRKFNVFQKNITNKTIETIAIPYQNDFIFIKTASIICIEANRVYSIVKIQNSNLEIEEFISTKSLSHYEDLFEEGFLLRIHRSWIINLKKVSYYSKKDNFIMIDDIKIPISRSYKDSVEKAILNE